MIDESKLVGLVLVLAAVLGAGCTRNQTVKAYEAWADEACACHDSACRNAAMAHGVKLAQDTQAAEGTLKDSQAVKAATSRAARCLNAEATKAATAVTVDAGGSR
jgi:hypothetical protein